MTNKNPPQSTAVKEAVQANEVRGAYFITFVVSIVLCSVVFFLFGKYSVEHDTEDNVKRAVKAYSTNSYEACKQQEKAVIGANGQQARRSCDYLLIKTF
jgi:hypothetical protein